MTDSLINGYFLTAPAGASSAASAQINGLWITTPIKTKAFVPQLVAVQLPHGQQWGLPLYARKL